MPNKQGLFSVGGILLAFNFLMSLLMHVALGYHSLSFSPPHPSSLLPGKGMHHVQDVETQTKADCLISSIFTVTTPRVQDGQQTGD